MVKPVTRQHGTLESRVRISQVARRQEVNIGAVAQLGERYSENVEVAGSTPAGTTSCDLEDWQSGNAAGC